LIVICLVSDICFQVGTAAQGRDTLVGAMDTNAILSTGSAEVSTLSDVSLIELTSSNASDLAT